MKKNFSSLLTFGICSLFSLGATAKSNQPEKINLKQEIIATPPLQKNDLCKDNQLLLLEIWDSSWGGSSSYTVSVKQDGRFQLTEHMNPPIPFNHQPGTRQEVSAQLNKADLAKLLSLFEQSKFFDLPQINTGVLHHSEGQSSEKLVFCQPNGIVKMVHGQLTSSDYQNLMKQIQEFFKEQIEKKNKSNQ